MQDFRGTPITVGAKVIYAPTQQGRMDLCEAVVTRLTAERVVIEAERYGWYGMEPQRTETIRTHPHRVVVIEEFNVATE